jgi:hypothetical protein
LHVDQQLSLPREAELADEVFEGADVAREGEDHALDAVELILLVLFALLVLILLLGVLGAPNSASFARPGRSSL